MVKKDLKKKKKSVDIVVQKAKSVPESKEEISESIKSEWEASFGEEYSGVSEKPVERVLTRTELLILDYKRFKAARTIQTAARAWYVRLIYLRKRQATITIQRFWRGFYYTRFYYKHLEEELQRRIVTHYNVSATRIQAFWRGWWVRTHVHDHYRLLRAQIRAAEELLHCVAFKLHYLLRTQQIPGIYSLRNSNAFSKVEKLLAALRYRMHNRNSVLLRNKMEGEIHDARKRFEQSRYYTVMPYKGFDAACDPKCKDLYQQKDADVRMHRILGMYHDAVIDPYLLHAQQCQERRKRTSVCKKPKPTAKPKPTFCGDVVKSLHRWRILSPRTTKINPDIFRTPENVDGFLSEIHSIYDRMVNDPCVCLATGGSLSALQ